MVAVAFDSYAPFDAGAGANVTEDTWRKLIVSAGPASGVLRGRDSALAVFGDSSGMQVKVPTGQVWINGHWGAVTSTKTVPLTAANASNARKDLIVARADFVNNKVELDVLTGTPAGSPTVPTVTQNSSIYEVQLAEVAVAAAASTISAGNVTDRRVFDCAVARYNQSGTASIANNAQTKVPFNTAVTFSGSVVPNTAGDQFTLNRDGWWIISAGLSYATGTTGYREVQIGTSSGPTIYAKQKTSASPDNNQVSVATAIQVTSGTAYSIYAYQTQGTSLNVNNTESGTWVSFTWIAY